MSTHFHELETFRNHFETFQAQDEDHVTCSPFRELSIHELGDILSLTIKEDKISKLIIFFNCLLAQTEADQFTIINTGGSSEGKTWNTLQISELFPEHELIIVGNASPTSFYHEHGILVKESYEEETGERKYVPIGEELQAIQTEISELKGKKEKTEEERQLLEELKARKSKLIASAKRLVDLSNKILIFLDQPNPKLLENLRSLISHDRKLIELHITNRSGKGQNYTEHILLQGFPSIIFCTAYQKLTEQEITRVFQVSPETSQQKLRQTVKLFIESRSNRTAWERKLESDLGRQSLIFRILLIRALGIKRFNSEKLRSLIENRFFATHRKLQPRNQRDIQRLYSLIHAHCLLNSLRREILPGGELQIQRQDVEEAFELYSQIGESNEHGVSPEVWEIFKLICDLYEKSARTGLTYTEIKEGYLKQFGRPLMMSSLRSQIMPALLDVGLVMDKENPEDRRERLFTPKLAEVGKDIPELIGLRLDSSKINSKSNFSKRYTVNSIIFSSFFDRLDKELAQNYDSFDCVPFEKSSSNDNKPSNDNKNMIRSTVYLFENPPKGYCSVCQTAYGRLLQEHLRFSHPEEVSK
jgi:hypothetical protein